MIERPIIFNGLTMNDQTKRSLMVSPYYFIAVRSVDGLWGSDIRYETHPIPSNHGERSGDVFYAGKTITLAGDIIARDLTTLRIGSRLMQEKFWDLQQYKLYFTLWGEVQSYVTCRVSQPLVITEEQATADVKRRFTVALRADNPRFYKASDSSLLYPWMA